MFETQIDLFSCSDRQLLDRQATTPNVVGLGGNAHTMRLPQKGWHELTAAPEHLQIQNNDK